MSYASYADYVIETGDTTTPQEMVEAKLTMLSARLRAMVGFDETRTLTEDQRVMASYLVANAAGHALRSSSLGGVIDTTGQSSASFSANGFSINASYPNASGSAYFDKATLKALRDSMGLHGQRVGRLMVP